MTRRRFIADTFTATTASLTGDQAHHLARVLRAQPGQQFDVVANGFLHEARIASITDSEVTFTLGAQRETEGALPLHLFFSVIKFDHYEWGIEKLTELGVARITPVIARRTEKHLAQSASKRADRWRRIGLESAKQSRRSDIPVIDEPVALKQALALAHAPTKLLLAETEQDNSLANALRRRENMEYPLAFAIGPEGGWTNDELEIFSTLNWLPVTLGPRILRAETAAITAAAICNALLE